MDNFYLMISWTFTFDIAKSKFQTFSKGRFFQKIWCIFLIAQKMCRKLSWKRYFEIAFCLESADSTKYNA